MILLLLVGASMLAVTPVSAQQTTDTFVLHLVTCPGPDDVVEIREAFDAEAEGCVDDWAEPSDWVVDGQPADSVNGYAQLFTGMDQGQTYQLDEQSGAYNFDGPYAFTFPETGDYSLYAVLYQADEGTTATPPDAGSGTPVAPQATASVNPPVNSATALYAGDCTPGSFIDPVAVINDAILPTGNPVGSSSTVSVASSFTRTDVPLDTLLDGGHVLAIFDPEQPDQLIACGMIGGVVDDSGALAIAIEPSQGSAVFGVAYLAPNGDALGISLFLITSTPNTSATPGT